MTFEEIYSNYSGKILNLAFRMIGREEAAHDLVQDIFIKVYESMDNFRGDSQVYTWIYRIATNHILNYIKKERRMKWLNLLDKPLSEVIREDEIEPTFPTGSAPRPDFRLEKKEREKAIWKIIQELAPKYRIPLVLNRYEDMNYNEIADIMQISHSAVETRLFRAKKELTKRLEPILNDL